MMEGPLRKLGAECRTNGGMPPVKIKGKMRGGSVEVDGSASSQFITGLLMALPLCEGDSVLKVSSLKSKPYVRMTLELLAEFGIKVRHDRELSRFEIGGGQRYRPRSLEVEGDWSSAAFLLVAGAIAGSVRISGLRTDSLQADRAIVDALKRAGANVRIENGKIVAEKSALKGFKFDASDCPDLFPPLAALACSCKGTTVLSGAGRLRGKESDRAASIVSELSAMGAKVRVDGNRMIITGGKLEGGEVDPHNDHRIAMACAVAALASEKGARINWERCVAKSYPGFFRDLESLRVS
jgi:3-phosphoshikimate 1-carboxyvinyltransferase